MDDDGQNDEEEMHIVTMMTMAVMMVMLVMMILVEANVGP